MDSWLYELRIALELITWLQEKRLISPDTMEIKRPVALYLHMEQSILSFPLLPSTIASNWHNIWLGAGTGNTAQLCDRARRANRDKIWGHNHLARATLRYDGLIRY